MNRKERRTLQALLRKAKGNPDSLSDYHKNMLYKSMMKLMNMPIKLTKEQEEEALRLKKEEEKLLENSLDAQIAERQLLEEFENTYSEKDKESLFKNIDKKENTNPFIKKI